MEESIKEDERAFREYGYDENAGRGEVREPEQAYQSDQTADRAAERRAMIGEQGDVAEMAAYMDGMVGRSLSEEESAGLISRMESKAEVAPEVELTPENWITQFGEDGAVETPLGTVKMGDNQYFKLAQQGRGGKLGMIKPTLQHPDIIIEDHRPAANSERDTSFILVKTFKKSDGSRFYYFTSVTVSKGGREVVISNQEKSKKNIQAIAARQSSLDKRWQPASEYAGREVGFL